MIEQLRAEMIDLQDEYNSTLRKQEYQIRSLLQESHCLQIENDALQKQIVKLQDKSCREQFAREHQEQMNRLKNTYDLNINTLVAKVDSLEREVSNLRSQITIKDQLYLKLEQTLSEQQQIHQQSVEDFQREINIQQHSIEELKFQYNLQSRRSGAPEDIIKYKRIIENQSEQIEQQGRLFNDLKNDLTKKLINERSKSQVSLKAAQDLKVEYEKKYSELMKQIINQQKSLTPRKSVVNSLDVTMNNDISRISNNQARNSVQNNSLDECSFLHSQSHIKKRTPSTNQVSSPKSIIRLQQQQYNSMISPRRCSRQSRNLNSNATSKGIKQYTFNLCENQDSECSTLQTRESRQKLEVRESRQICKKASANKKYRDENTIPDEHLEINAVHSNKQCSMMEEKEERLNTNTRFNSLLKIL